MKILSIIVALLLNISLFSACSTPEKEGAEKPSLKKEEPNVIELEKGIFLDKNWDETVGTYRGAVVPNEEVALEIAKEIFDAMEKSDAAQEYVPQSVFYDEQDGIWIVSFWEETDEITVGGDCSIAIQKSDGRVLRIWFGE